MPEEKKQTDATGSTQGSKKKKGLVIGLVLLAVLAGVGVATHWLGLFASKRHPVGQTAAGGRKKEALRITEVITIPPVIVNLASDPFNRMSYARLGISLAISNPSPGQAMFRQEVVIPKVTDRLLARVGQMTAADLLKPETKEQIKTEIKDDINLNLREQGSSTGDGAEGASRVVEVYFTEFVIQ
ncbi:MAG: flagellar basal body-associated protein FliL [Acidobacteriota bacterium]